MTQNHLQKYVSVNGEKGSDEMLAPIWRPAGKRTNVSDTENKKKSPVELLSQVAVVSTERQFDSHYLEEHLDLDLEEQQRNSTYEDEDEFQCSEQMKERGACIVKSDFDPKTLKYKSTPGLLKTKKGETLVILQNDLGSGWTCVRNSNTSQTGFVPSNHLEILS